MAEQEINEMNQMIEQHYDETEVANQFGYQKTFENGEQIIFQRENKQIKFWKRIPYDPENTSFTFEAM